MRLIIVGHAGVGPVFTVESQSGRRLRDLFGLSSFPGYDEIANFATVENLCTTSDVWNINEAEMRAMHIRQTLPDRYVICGALAGRAILGNLVRFDFWAPLDFLGGRAMVIPHPSGRNHFWNNVNLAEYTPRIQEFVGPRYKIECPATTSMTWHSFEQGWDVDGIINRVPLELRRQMRIWELTPRGYESCPVSL